MWTMTFQMFKLDLEKAEEPGIKLSTSTAAAAAAKSLQSYPTLKPHRRQPTRLSHPWDSPGKNTGVGCHFLLQCMKVKTKSQVAQSCPTLSNPKNCSLPGSSIHGIFQARVLEWVAITFSTTPTGSSKKQESSEKHLLLLDWLCQSLWLCGSPQTVENSERDGNTRPTDLPPQKSVKRSRSNS